MIAEFVAGLGVGLGVFYITWTLLEADGWLTVNKVLRFAPQELQTTDDLLCHVGVQSPVLGAWMGCAYCMVPWFSAFMVWIVSASMLAWFTAIGVAGILHALIGVLREQQEKDPDDLPF